jgi:hypothetical protein
VPSLVEQLQADALDCTVPVTGLLRKAKAAAVKLRRTDLTQWIENELSGYKARDDLPPYRVLHAELRFFKSLTRNRGGCGFISMERCWL